MTSKERFMAALSGRPCDRTPVFPLLMMLTVDRYGISYRQFVTDGQAMAQAQLYVREKYGVDAITACSDAFRIAADLGGEMVFPEDKPPHLAAPLVRGEQDMKRLTKPDVAKAGGRMAGRVRAVEEMVRAAGEDCMVLGWVDMPMAEACSACGVTEFMMMLYDEPALAHRLLQFLTDAVIDFAVAQVQAGAPMIGCGDAVASLVSAPHYREFALPYEQQVIQAVHDAGGLVKLHICGNTTDLLPDMVRSGADLFNVDHLVPFAAAMEVYGAAGKAFKGNLDPVADMMQATPQDCERKARTLIQKAKGLRYMLSPGCEIPAMTTDEVFHAFIQSGKE